MRILCNGEAPALGGNELDPAGREPHRASVKSAGGAVAGRDDANSHGAGDEHRDDPAPEPRDSPGTGQARTPPFLPSRGVMEKRIIRHRARVSHRRSTQRSLRILRGGGSETRSRER